MKFDRIPATVGQQPEQTELDNTFMRTLRRGAHEKLARTGNYDRLGELGIYLTNGAGCFGKSL